MVEWAGVAVARVEREKRKLNDQAKGEQVVKVSESEVRKGQLKDVLDERDEQAVP